MSLKDRFDAARGPVKTSFERWVDSLDQEDRKAIFLAAPDEGISHRAFLDAVKAEGSGAGYDRVIAWRKEQGFGRSSK